MNNQELTINWHIAEACNYVCRYCFAKWEKSGRELLHFSDGIAAMITEIAKLPVLFNQQKGTSFDSVRLNLVGGEPLLYKAQTMQIIRAAREQGLALSMVTNGSLLDDEWCEVIARDFKGIGISIDSVSGQTNLDIGRHAKNQLMPSEQVVRRIQAIRAGNPNIGIKINTVVNQLNYRENMADFIAEVAPDKWKIFKMLPMITEDLSIDDTQFQQFLDRHQEFHHLICSENNNEMVDSYVMIDPLGRFFRNSLQVCGGYRYSQPIYQVGAERALTEMYVDTEKYRQRYITIKQRKAA
ncbi:viperin family antiviral radical SAM protein [Neisseria chenwenguii]|uniref:S-adenosylmethionine-dependent nucleotide dehydratase n=1 Tax=Neisseria chenwenguii TaxID=1853278 RepID=A0A220S2V2_9NEIS|nr:viperin family antiviral radical SAM protein [Neisseria chenwenguii]ASK27525.1 radical SAM protein [Neisseria chenwenguii]ROV55603.1 radical SAM protein [Neisseria chenwenguii]